MLHANPPSIARIHAASGLAVDAAGGSLPPRFLRHHLYLPLAGWALLSLLLMPLGGDFWLEDQLYALQGHQWAWQDTYLTQHLLHSTARQWSKDAWFLLALVTLVSLPLPRLRRWRAPLLGLLVSTALSIWLVARLKHATHMDCPWDLLRYGGHLRYYSLWQARPQGLAASNCFPAGHASAGYAWVALYFFLLASRPRWRFWGLATGLGLGMVFGLTQQLRGAHFLSHDLWSLLICWLTALVVYLPVRRLQAAGSGAWIRPPTVP